MCEVEPDMVREVVQENNRLIKENAELVERFNDLRDKAFFTNSEYKKCMAERDRLRGTVDRLGLAIDKWRSRAVKNRADSDRYREALLGIEDYHITEITDAHNMRDLATEALK